MVVPYKYLKVTDGIIALVESPSIKTESKGISIFVSDIGVVVQVQDIRVPILDDFLNHMTDNPYLTLYFTDTNRYYEESYLTIELDKKGSNRINHSLCKSKILSYNRVGQKGLARG